jgi:VWFA-related protein
MVLFSRLRRSVLWTLLGAVALQAPPLFARQDPPRQPTFRADIPTVQFDVIVRDREGRFVFDLGPEDFEVQEDGQPQAVDTAFLVSHDPAALLEGAGLAPAVGVARAPRLLVLVFDSQHLAPNSFNRLKDAAAQFLGEHFRPGDVAGIVAEGEMVGGRLTGNLEELMAAVRGLKASGQQQSRLSDMRSWPRLVSVPEAVEIDRGNRQVIENAVMRACAEEPDEGPLEICADWAEGMLQAKAASRVAEVRDAADLAIRLLETLARGMGRFPGRKTVVFLSEGFLFDPLQGRLRQVVSTAARSGVTFYSLDARGLGRDRAAAAIETVPPADGGDFLSAAADTTDHGLNSLAADTGGFVVRHTNNFGRALADIASDTGTYYVLGYRPSNDRFDGAFRSLTVRVRRPGVTVRARAGYVADAEGPLGAEWNPPSPAGREAGFGETGLTADSGIRAVAEATHASPLQVVRDLSHIHMLVGVTGPPSPAGREAGFGEASPPPPPGADPLSAPMPVDDLPPDLAALATDGWAHYQRGDVEGAEARLARAAAAPGGPPVWVHYALGMSRFALWQYAESAASWEQVREARPDFRPVYFDLVDSYLQLDDLDRALAVLRAAEDRWPDDADVLNALGVILVRRRALEDARDMFARALEQHPQDETALFNLAKTYEMLFVRSRRYIAHQSQWVFNRDYWRRSWELYTRYLETGGPHDREVREGLTRLGRNRM